MRKTSGFGLYRFAFSFLGPSRKKYLLGVLLGSCELALLFAMPYLNETLIDLVGGPCPHAKNHVPPYCPAALFHPDRV